MFMDINTHAKINWLINYLIKKHEEIPDKGCKGSCHCREIGVKDEDGKRVWFCRFGGYCFGNMPRRVEIIAGSINELLTNVTKEVDKEIRVEYEDSDSIYLKEESK